ncbi:aminotransferase class I/II-fold pyridoxal phosphate-dependent enzyme [Patescibacteria group bacterium]|nr:aminotransferase class I/II-fold pyridoxal phosphate-dependent enzyme [Patescibacteria group bacterium]
MSINYLRKAEIFKQGIDRRDYSLSNNNVDDEYDNLLPNINSSKLFDLAGKYPDYRYKELTNALRNSFGINNIILGSGSEDLIIRINSCLKKSGGIGVLLPNFYRTTETAGKYTKFYSDYKLNSEILDINFLSNQIERNKKIKALWISNPNPMIGKIYKKEHLLHLIKKYPNILFIIDEALIDFTEREKEYSVIKDAQLLDNLVVMRSFSKLYSLAGLRVGYATGKANILEKIKENGLTFPVSSIAEHCIINVLKKKNVLLKIKKRIKKHKLLLEEVLSKTPDIIISKSATNCIFFGHKKINTFSELLKIGIISLELNNHDGMREKNFVRITVHSSEYLFNDLFHRILKFIKLNKS